MLQFSRSARTVTISALYLADLENRLQAGDRLPAVQELAEQFGVSRTVIREAIAPAAKGLLEVHHGSGTVVRHPAPKLFNSRWRFTCALDSQCWIKAK